MANFCTNCGAPVAGKFCTACGATAPGASPAGAPPAGAAPAAAASGGSALKIILIVVGALFVMGAIGVGSVIYIGYKAKQKITELARENGIPVGSDLSAAEAPRVITSRPSGGGCTVLSGEDAQKILNVAIERVETTSGAGQDPVCRYWISLAERRRQGAGQIASGISGLSKSDGKDPDLNEAAKIVAGALTAVTTTQTSGPDDFSMEVEVQRTGGKEAFEKLHKAQEQVNSVTSGFGLQNVEGVGDQAFLSTAGQVVMVLKGDSVLTLSFHQFAPGPEKATALAKKAAQGM